MMVYCPFLLFADNDVLRKVWPRLYNYRQRFTLNFLLGFATHVTNVHIHAHFTYTGKN